MNFTKYFAFLALLVLCLLGQQTTEGRLMRKSTEHKLIRDGKDVVKVAGDVDKVYKVGKEVFKIGSAFADDA